MARARLISVVLIAIALVVSIALPIHGQDWLPNGDFESGTSGWSYTGADPADCEPQAGNAALGFSSTSPQGYVERVIPGPIAPGTYTLTGWTRVQSGTGSAEIKLAFIGEFGSVGGMAVPTGLVTGNEYTFFTATVNAIRAFESGVLSFYFTPGTPAVLCIDSLRLTTEDPTATPTPSPTATQPPDATSTHTPTGTSTLVVPTATGTSSPAPTLTPTTSPSATAAPSATRTPTPAPTATSGPSFVFANGGFEQGLAGWSKYGGTLTTTTNARSGGTAGLLISDTEATKWAFQSVRIDPAQHYEFAGHVQADGGVNEAYLRISWYATSDATGSAMATSDSSQRAAPGGYVFLTTGAVQPPPGAASARVRVVLAPAGAATASLGIDDVTFGTTAAATPAPTASLTPTPVASGTPSPTVALLGGIAATPENAAVAEPRSDQETAHSVLSQASAAPVSQDGSSAIAAASATPGPVQEVASARSEARASTSDATQPSAFGDNEASKASGAGSWPWVLGAGLLVFGLGGAYLQGRRADG